MDWTLPEWPGSTVDWSDMRDDIPVITLTQRIHCDKLTSFEDIGKELGISKQMAHKEYKAAIKKFRARFKNRLTDLECHDMIQIGTEVHLYLNNIIREAEERCKD